MPPVLQQQISIGPPEHPSVWSILSPASAKEVKKTRACYHSERRDHAGKEVCHGKRPNDLEGTIHGKTIELDEPPGLPDGQAVTVAIERIEKTQPATKPGTIPPVESWLDRLVFDAALLPGERIVKGTRLPAETLVAELNKGRSDAELLQAFPELSAEDVQALRNYAQVPVGLRRSCGAWAEDAEELDHYLEWTRQQRKSKRREIQD